VNSTAKNFIAKWQIITIESACTSWIREATPIFKVVTVCDPAWQHQQKRSALMQQSV
jgi:hypothetical protein